MATVIETIRRVFPNGTNVFPAGSRRDERAIYSTCPRWPPDAFAVAALLVELTGCYADVRYGGLGSNSLFRDQAWRQQLIVDGIAWRESRSLDDHRPQVPQANIHERLKKLWQTLLDHGDAPVAYADEPDDDTYTWWDAAVTLMLTADEASTGMGFPTPRHLVEPLLRRIESDDKVDAAEAREEFETLMRQRQFADVVQRQYLRASLPELQAKIPAILPQPIESLCRLASLAEVSVQPKTITAQTGMTLRSLTHHLSLLPPRGEVSTRWIPSNSAQPLASCGEEQATSDDPVLNLMLVPFPYRINGTAFLAGGTSIDAPHVADRVWTRDAPNFFDLDQHWLRSDGGEIKPSEMAAFLGALIARTKREVREVHGIVLPELALSLPLFKKVIPLLAAETQIEFIVSGVLDLHPDDDTDRPEGTAPEAPSGLAAETLAIRKRCARNRVAMINFDENRDHPDQPILQSKHHRWQLERHQIRRYHLGHTLSTRTRWWEKIDVSNRNCNFFVFRPGACLAALVCEDLARVDPVQRVLRAVGPNLVIALLLDGPQLVGRWSHRYATVLAEDPGSAVLTLTAVGMVERSVDPGQPVPDKVALWRDARGEETLELSLPRDAHALLLSIETKYEEHKTLDGRTDHRATAALNLAGVRAIQHPAPPAWASRG